MTRGFLATVLMLVMTGSAAWAQFPATVEKVDYQVFANPWEDPAGAVVSPDGTPGIPAYQLSNEPLNSEPIAVPARPVSAPVVIWSSQAPVVDNKTPSMMVTAPAAKATAPVVKVSAPAAKATAPAIKVATGVVQSGKPAPIAPAKYFPARVGSSPYAPVAILTGGVQPQQPSQPKMTAPTNQPISANPPPISPYPAPSSAGTPCASCVSGHCHAPCGHRGCRHRCDLQSIWAWLTYHPVRSRACTGKLCTPACQPGLYEFFLPCPVGHAPRLPGCASCGHH
jgi:hypothetical protein